MVPKRHGGNPFDGETNVQAAYDYCEGSSAFIIADVTVDDAWVAVRREEAKCVESHR